MKLNKLILIAAGLFMTMTACQKNILDLAPEDNISDAEFWKTPSDLQLYANSFYNALPSYTGFNTIGNYGDDADQGSDNMIAFGGYNTAMNGERAVPATGGGWSWSSLRNINYFLERYSKVNASSEAVNPYVGEAYFFRAYFYFNMLKTFGDLPWINKVMQVSDSTMIYSARLPRNIIADSIINDLDKAINLLPTKSKAQTMRINKEIAMGLQSRIALYEGTWEKYHAGSVFGVVGSDGTKYLQKAAAVSDALITSGVHQLDNVGVADGYWKLFNQTSQSASKEVMLWRAYSATGTPQLVTNWARYTIAGAARGLTKNLVDAYLCTDGKPISASSLYKGDDSLKRVVTNRDPRLAQTIYVPDNKHYITQGKTGTADLVFTVPAFNNTDNTMKPATGYQLYKGHSPDYAQQSAQNIGTNSLIMMRYAEVLLNYAEAKAELGDISQADLDKSINKLRQRVGMPNLSVTAITTDPKWEFPALSPIINEVRRERRVELACEGYRKDDIFRWAAADELIVGWKPKGAKRLQWMTDPTVKTFLTNAAYPVDANGYIEKFQASAPLATGYKFRIDRDYLSPIPSNEINLNPNLKQNPNW
ncbi:RagB/SusD family nutrient uptake outer membrane protein [Solitalea koreensis]|uniref:Starch-binding associating with outer membrane n=1 Tax=Solitalea koreensis TaxID=543615 RepID=A0A521AZS4_9SPHI|nr:RagB/SusD family nutrient uptake outer membrane protein [Solitalea koreensis]SMO40332.1 Starch-binding associating with outer membrane [Solitalea koreensis]